MKRLTVVEFYSGIGGMHYGLRGVESVDVHVAAAFDINTVANAVYRHNFPNVPLQQRNIQSLTNDELDAINADLFTMSPPCQPFTRQGKQMDVADNRTNSFIHLLEIFSQMKNLPRFMFLENVKGFENSEARKAFIAFLGQGSYSYREFLLSPTQFGVPNSRLRYYLLAKLKAMDQEDFPISNEEQILTTPPQGCSWKDQDSISEIREYLEFPPEISANPEIEQLFLNDRTLAKYGEILDIVKATDRRSCCFTKGYGHYVEGTGSVLQTSTDISLEQRYAHYRSTHNLEERTASLRPLGLRYFSPREVANLMCFPEDFDFPSDISTKQKYRLLGNSVNVKMITILISWLVNQDKS